MMACREIAQGAPPIEYPGRAEAVKQEESRGSGTRAGLTDEDLSPSGKRDGSIRPIGERGHERCALRAVARQSRRDFMVTGYSERSLSRAAGRPLERPEYNRRAGGRAARTPELDRISRTSTRNAVQSAHRSPQSTRHARRLRPASPSDRRRGEKADDEDEARFHRRSSRLHGGPYAPDHPEQRSLWPDTRSLRRRRHRLDRRADLPEMAAMAAQGFERGARRPRAGRARYGQSQRAPPRVGAKYLSGP